MQKLVAPEPGAIAPLPHRNAWLRELKSTTASAYGKCADKFTVYCRGRDIDPLKISKAEVRAFFAESDGAPKSIGQLFHGVKSYYRYLVDIDIMEYNPVAVCGFRLPTQAALKQPRALEDWEVKRLIKHCKTVRHKAMIGILFGGGLRVSEVAALTKDDVGYVRGVMCLSVRHGKGDKFRRVPLPVGAAELVKEQLRCMPKGQASLFNMRAPAMYVAIRSIAKRASLKDISTHCGRVTAITTLYHAGDRLEEIVQFTGHASVATAERYIRRNPTINTPNLKLNYF